ncbi:MAG: cobalt ECF transporter T component CbiQ [Promethearchaeota archaeon]
MVFSKLLKFIRESLILEETSRRNSLIHKIDPRIKIFSTLTGIICTILVSNIIIFLLIFSFVFAIAITARVPIKEFFFRTLFFVTLFAIIIAIPLPFITPGTPIASWSLDGLTITVTREGLYTALKFILRVWITVSLANLLILTTSFDKISNAFDRLHFPKTFTLLFDLTLRYIFVIADEALKVSRARDSRTVNKMNLLQRMKSVGTIVTNILRRSYKRAERVYNAMLARGFNGKFRSLTTLRITPKDLAYFVIFSGGLILLLLVDTRIVFPSIVPYLNSLMLI